MGGHFAFLILIIIAIAIVVFGIYQFDVFRTTSLEIPEGLKDFFRVLQWGGGTKIALRDVPVKSNVVLKPISETTKPLPVVTSTLATSTLPRPSVREEDIPAGFTLEQLSPYYDRITVQNSFYNTQYGTQVRLYVYSLRNLPEIVNVTSWHMKANKGGTYYIPQAIGNYDPYGSLNMTDIILETGHTVTMYATSSPAGTGMRLNKCVGYLERNLKFTPALPLQCPYDFTDRDAISHLSGACQDYIRRLSRCETPDINQRFILTEPECRSYLEDINYRTCYIEHRNDKDFFSKEWRLWETSLKRFPQFDRRHDRILLFDKEGLLVDEFLY